MTTADPTKDPSPAASAVSTCTRSSSRIAALLGEVTCATKNPDSVPLAGALISRPALRIAAPRCLRCTSIIVCCVISRIQTRNGLSSPR